MGADHLPTSLQSGPNLRFKPSRRSAPTGSESSRFALTFMDAILDIQRPQAAQPCHFTMNLELNGRLAAPIALGDGLNVLGTALIPRQDN
jgi:hypothetical protein